MVWVTVGKSGWLGVCEGTVGLGHCLCASGLKHLLFSMLANGMKKEGKTSSVSRRGQTGYLISRPPFFISERQMQVSKHTNSQLQHFSGMAN